MKKLKKLLAVVGLATIATSSVMLSGCSGSIEGEYKFKEMYYEYKGTTTTYRVGDKIDGVTLTKESIVLVLRDDDAILRLYSELDGEEEKEVMVGTWTKGYDGEIYVLFNDTVELILEKSGRTIKGDYDGMTITLKK